MTLEEENQALKAENQKLRERIEKLEQDAIKRSDQLDHYIRRDLKSDFLDI